MKKLAILAAILGAVSQTMAAQPRFTSVSLAEGDSISLTLVGDPLTSYTILATTDLKSSFTPIGAVVTDATGAATFTDPAARATSSQKFYRARRTALANASRQIPNPRPLTVPASSAAPK